VKSQRAKGKEQRAKNKPYKKQLLFGSCSGFVWVTFGKMAFNPNKTSFIPKDDRTNLAFKKIKILIISKIQVKLNPKKGK